MKLLLIVDPQIDFITGTLPVPNAQEKMSALADFIKAHDGDYVLKVITTDFHPFFHCSFKAQGGPWPQHCVQDSVGAAIFQPLLEAVYLTQGDVHILRKGDLKDREEYSIFKNEHSAKVLLELISQSKIDKIEICGLAGDICVLNTLKDGIELLGKDIFHVLEEFSPSLDGGKSLKEFLAQA